MARADRRRVQRQRTNARGRAGTGPVKPRRSSPSAPPSLEDQLFFQRLRVHAKWIFVLLALLFGVTFVGFGVGSQVPGGIADLLGRSADQSGLEDVDEARERVEKNPQDADAQRSLATGLQQRGEAEEAIAPLEAYIRLRPSDEDALRELASLYLARAARYQREAQIAQLQQAQASPGAPFLPPASTPFGQALQPPVAKAVEDTYSEELTEVYSNLSAANTKAKETYAKVARLAPNDPDIQLQLASASESAGDIPGAIAAYEKFLEIAPDHTSAELVKERIKQLRTPAAAPTSG